MTIHLTELVLVSILILSISLLWI